MAYTYLQLANRALVKINEVEMTSGNFASSRGIQTLAKNTVNDAIRDLIAEELEWPFNVASTTQALTAGTQEYAVPTGTRSIDWDSFFIKPVNEVTNGEFTSAITSWTDKSAGSGTAAYTSDGNGRARLTGDGTDIGAIEQILSTTVNQKYRIVVRTYSNDITLTIGTTTGGTNLLSEVLTIESDGDGQTFTFTFTATTTTSFLRFALTSTTAGDVDFVRVGEDRDGRPLILMNQTEWHSNLGSGPSRTTDKRLSGTGWTYPTHVFKTQDDKFGVTPVPSQGNWEVDFDYWATPSDLSAVGDTTAVPDHYEHILTHRIDYYMLLLRSDPAIADRANKMYKEGVKLMRMELINRPDSIVAK
jgi:hypothetical protein|tara:strand:- start:3781 stop:4860 length:1080 start_codon:yes stop_codon:yes gene_type:complete